MSAGPPAVPPSALPASARSAPPSALLRLARLLRPGRNPLARGVDRTEGTIVILFALLALALVPVLLTLGSLTYAALAERGAQEAGARHETVAVLTEDAPVTAAGTPGEMTGATVKVAARWQLPDGSTRTGRVDVDTGLKAGAEVPVWLDSSGTPVAPPMSESDAAVAGALVAAGGWIAVAGLFALVGWGLHRVFDRRRYRAWDTEWAAEGPGRHKGRR